MPSTLDQQQQLQTRESMVIVAKNLAIDGVSAAVASFAVSPFITIVDRAIIENASGARPLALGVKQLSRAFLQNPFQFVRKREFMIVFGLYTSTYASANAIDTVCEYAEADNQMPKFLGTTAVNMTLCIAKDRAFAQMFGVVAPSAFPIGAVGLFAIRDSLTVGASFNAPKTVAKKLEVDGGVEPSRAKTIAQLLCPAAVQFVSTPLHLLGLDLYNNKSASAVTRLKFVQREYIKSAVARIGRIGPAFGIGGVGNTYCRENLRARFN